MVKYFLFTDPDEAARAPVLAREWGTHWIRLGDQTLIWMDLDIWESRVKFVTQIEIHIDPLDGKETSGQLFLVSQVGRVFQNAFADIQIVLDKGRYLIVDLLSDHFARLKEINETHWDIRTIPVDQIIFDIISPKPLRTTPWIQSLVSAVSQMTYTSYLTSLVGYPTRHSLTNHYADAATYAENELKLLGYQTQLQTIAVGSGSSYNVVAERQGLAGGNRNLVLITAHLDSINGQGGQNSTAPGADDNASGSAALLEIARIFSTHSSKHNLRFILFGGEEQGLIGSTQYVSNLTVSERLRVKAVINMDMIGTLNTATPAVLLEGSTVSQDLMTNLSNLAGAYTSLNIQTSLNPFASDHVPFINANIPSVLTIEGADSANSNIHTANDTLDHLNYGLALEITRLNTAATATYLDIHVVSENHLHPSSNSVVAWGSNRLDAFVLGTNSSLYHKWWNGSSWGPSVTGYEYMGGKIISDPEVVSWGSDRLDAFVLGTNSSLYHKWWNGSSWGPSVTGYEYMGGKIINQPKVVSWGLNRLDVFVLGTNSSLYHKWWNGSVWGPSVTGYEYMGGKIINNPEVASWGPNRLDVFVIGNNSSLYHKWWNGSSWGPSVTGYEYMGGKILGSPKVVSWGPNRLDVFVLGTNSAVYHKWWNGSAWGPSVTGYENMGGKFLTPPAVVSWGPNRIDLFAIGTNSSLYHKWWDGTSWKPSVTGWEDLGGKILGKPRVVAWGSNRLDVFVLGTNSSLYHKWWNGSSWGPSVTGYEYMGGKIIGL